MKERRILIVYGVQYVSLFVLMVSSERVYQTCTSLHPTPTSTVFVHQKGGKLHSSCLKISEVQCYTDTNTNPSKRNVNKKPYKKIKRRATYEAKEYRRNKHLIIGPYHTVGCSELLGTTVKVP
jgi:hypothetical protein